MNARELHDITKGLIDKQVDRLCYGTDERQIVLRALDLLASVEESEDELVRELRDQADEERQFEYPERAKLLDMAAATIVALKARAEKAEEFQYAVNDGDNTLHGAIDHWQAEAQKFKAERDAQEAKAFLDWCALYEVSVNVVADERGSLRLNWYRGEVYANSWAEFPEKVNAAIDAYRRDFPKEEA